MNEEKLDVKWMTCNPAPDDVGVFILASYF